MTHNIIGFTDITEKLITNPNGCYTIIIPLPVFPLSCARVRARARAHGFQSARTRLSETAHTREYTAHRHTVS